MKHAHLPLGCRDAVQWVLSVSVSASKHLHPQTWSGLPPAEAPLTPKVSTPPLSRLLQKHGYCQYKDALSGYTERKTSYKMSGYS